MVVLLVYLKVALMAAWKAVMWVGMMGVSTAAMKA